MVIKIDSQQNQAVGVTVTSRRSSLRWCLILSLIVHGLVLFIFLFLSKPEMRSSSFMKAVLTPSPPEETEPSNQTAERAISRTTRGPRPQNSVERAVKETKPSLPDSPPSGRDDSSSPAQTTVPKEEALGPAGTALESGGIDIGAAGGSPSGKGTTIDRAGSAVNSAVSGETGSGEHDTTGYRGAQGTRPGGGIFQPAIPAPALKIPADEFRGSPFAVSEVYIEVDRYVLYGHNLRHGITVPANEICLEGDLLRTRETATFKRIVTDMSKCRMRREGDDEVVTCPSNAETKVIVFHDYLFSPVVYGVRTCSSTTALTAVFWMLEMGNESTAVRQIICTKVSGQPALSSIINAQSPT
jgi:hypothetical protein